MSSGWFETVAAAQRRARKQLPKSVYWSIVAGSEQGATLKDNVAAFGELGFTPHAAGLPAKRDLATTVLGQELSMPVLCENVLDILRGGIDSALLGLGKAAIRDLTPDDIVVPPGFTTLGGDGPVFDPAASRQAATG